MKKIKKILAAVMTLAMVLGMSMTTLAADPVNVTVTNLDEDAIVTYAQIITPDQEEPTGWTFTAEGAAFKNSISSATGDEQDVIWGLLLYAGSIEETDVPESANPVEITAAELEDAFGAVSTTNTASLTGTTATFPVSTAGVYAIHATTSGKYSYSPMGAYVSFEYNKDGSVSGLDDNVTVNAKKAETQVDKSSDEQDSVVAVDKEVTYTIRTTVPYIPESVKSVNYTITDTIRGAVYAATEGILNVDVQVGTGAVDHRTVTVMDAEPVGTHDNNQTFTIDLSDIATVRDNANKSLTLTYKAIVKELTVNNSAKPNDGVHDYTEDTDQLYTGTVTMTKKGENSETLSGAGFKVYYEDGATTYWALTEQKRVEGSPVAGEYYVTGWTTVEEDADEIFTTTGGTVKLAGLDDTVTYFFKETTAPEGYSINTKDEAAKWNVSTPADAKTGTVEMTDTQLDSLPETGGIGTTIFTIGGCIIMIAAAGLFFASRRKSSK